jgi:hypothetical protein
VWLLGGLPRTLRVPAAQTSRVDAITETLAAETLRSMDVRSVDLYRHLLLTLLLWVAITEVQRCEVANVRRRVSE